MARQAATLNERQAQAADRLIRWHAARGSQVKLVQVFRTTSTILGREVSNLHAVFMKINEGNLIKDLIWHDGKGKIGAWVAQQGGYQYLADGRIYSWVRGWHRKREDKRRFL